MKVGCWYKLTSSTKTNVFEVMVPASINLAAQVYASDTLTAPLCTTNSYFLLKWFSF